MKKFFFICWGDPKFYQTLIFLAQFLSRKGFKVYILSKNNEKKKDIIKDVNFGKNIYLIQPSNFLSNYGNIFDYIIFNFFILKNFITIKPEYIIFFNKKALYNSLLLKFFKRKKIKFIYHNFDFELLKNSKNLKEFILIKLEFYCSKICDYLIFPSKNRSLKFKKNSKNNKSKYFSLMNCFPLNFNINSSNKLKKFLYKKKINKCKIICHLGSIGPNHYLEEIILSIQYLKENIVLLIGGSPIGDYAIKLRKLIFKKNLSEKIFIFENITNDFWFDILRNSDLGLCFYKSSVLSHKYMAGTSQKFNNYVCFKIPMIVNDNLDFRSFRKKKFDIYNIVNSNKPKEIASEINKVLFNRNRYKKIKKNMVNAYKKELNFDYQFSKSYKNFLKN